MIACWVWWKEDFQDKRRFMIYRTACIQGYRDIVREIIGCDLTEVLDVLLLLIASVLIHRFRHVMEIYVRDENRSAV